MRISDWSSDVCSSDLPYGNAQRDVFAVGLVKRFDGTYGDVVGAFAREGLYGIRFAQAFQGNADQQQGFAFDVDNALVGRQQGIGGSADVYQQCDGHVAPLVARLLDGKSVVGGTRGSGRVDPGGH